MASGDPTDQILNVEAEFIKIANTLNEIIKELRSYQQSFPEKVGEIKQDQQTLIQNIESIKSRIQTTDTLIPFLQKIIDEPLPGVAVLLKPIEDKTNEFQSQFINFNNEYRTNYEQYNERFQNYQSQLQDIAILSKEIHQQTETLSLEIHEIQKNISGSEPNQDLFQKMDAIIISQKALSDSVHNVETKYLEIMPLIEKYSENLEKIEEHIDLLNQKVDSIPELNIQEIQKSRKFTDKQIKILHNNIKNTNHFFFIIIYVMVILFVLGSLLVIGAKII